MIFKVWAVFAVVMLGWTLWQRGRLPYHGETHLLTPTERAFYHVLNAAVGQTFHIVYKIRLGDIVGCSDHFWNRGFGRKIATQHIDFVLVEPGSARIRLCIELDDPSHNTPRQQRRDRWKNLVMHKAGIKLMRVKTRHDYDTDKLRRHIWATLRTPRV